MLLVVVGSAQAEEAVPQSRFQRIAQALQASTQERRSEFASAALVELLAVYLAEADLARSEAQRGGRDRQKLFAWSLAVDGFASQLQNVLDDIESGFPVELGLRRKQSVVLKINERIIMLTHPRHAQQFAYEQQVLADFCSRSDCGALVEARQQPLRLPLYVDSLAHPEWSFTESGPVCAYQGIQVYFSNPGDLARLREVCQHFFQEVIDLLTEMTWQQLHGAAIDWQALEIRPTPGQTEHFIQLNDAGDSILATLPMLYAFPGLLRQLGPWLRDRSAGADAALSIDGGAWEDWQPGM